MSALGLIKLWTRGNKKSNRNVDAASNGKRIAVKFGTVIDELPIGIPG